MLVKIIFYVKMFRQYYHISYSIYLFSASLVHIQEKLMSTLNNYFNVKDYFD